MSPTHDATSDELVPVVCVGASWGGVTAVRTLLGALPDDVPAAICVVLHRAEHDGPAKLAAVLRRATTLTVCEPDDKDRIKAGTVYVAPAGYHLLVDGDHVALSTDDRVRWARPSVDVLFESAAGALGPTVVGVVLTGANDDGACGARTIVAAGGTVLVQDPEEAERREMPDAAIAATDVTVLPLGEIADEIVRRVGGTGAG